MGVWAPVFRAPWHPLPIVVFLILVAVLVILFAVGRPLQTLIGAAVIALGIPASWVAIQRPRADAPTVASLGTLPGPEGSK